MMFGTEFHKIDIKSGTTISATFFRPESAPAAAVLISSAMGVNQRYYTAFAQWLACEGYLVATFDYTGTGLSCNGDIRKLDTTIIDWARFDCDAMISALVAMAPGIPLYWIGHSLGGQILGFISGLSRISKIITVVTGSGYWKENTPAVKWLACWLWYVAVPLSTALFGYFPGKPLRKVGNLPPGVINQWRRWCLDPDYHVGAEGDDVRKAFAQVKTPITSISFADDEMMSARNIDSLLSFYSAAPKHMKCIYAADTEGEHVGHFGFFRAHFKHMLWQKHLLPELNCERLDTEVSG